MIQLLWWLKNRSIAMTWKLQRGIQSLLPARAIVSQSLGTSSTTLYSRLTLRMWASSGMIPLSRAALNLLRKVKIKEITMLPRRHRGSCELASTTWCRTRGARYVSPDTTNHWRRATGSALQSSRFSISISVCVSRLK